MISRIFSHDCHQNGALVAWSTRLQHHLLAHSSLFRLHLHTPHEVAMARCSLHWSSLSSTTPIPFFPDFCTFPTLSFVVVFLPVSPFLFPNCPCKIRERLAIRSLRLFLVFPRKTESLPSYSAANTHCKAHFNSRLCVHSSFCPLPPVTCVLVFICISCADTGSNTTNNTFFLHGKSGMLVAFLWILHRGEGHRNCWDLLHLGFYMLGVVSSRGIIVTSCWLDFRPRSWVLPYISHFACL